MGTALCSAWPGLCRNPLRGEDVVKPLENWHVLAAGLGVSAGDSRCEMGCPDPLEPSWTAGAEGWSYTACFCLKSLPETGVFFSEMFSPDP